MNVEEDEAAKSFLSDHFSGDLNAVASGLGAWVGVIKKTTSENFTYVDESAVTYLPFDEDNVRLAPRYSVCGAINYFFALNDESGQYEQQLGWQENFRRRKKMPFC